MSKWLDIAEVKRLADAAGPKCFARGQDYAKQSQIALLSANDRGILAAAFGTSDCTAWLERSGSGISGHCSCPAFEDSGFCKHMAATAIVANADKAAPDRIGAVATRIAKLDKQRLEKLVLEMVGEEWRVLRALCLALRLDWEDDFDQAGGL